MIGVLAVISILAAMLIPKIFTAINNARLNNAVMAVNTIRQATADSYAKYGNLKVGLNLANLTNIVIDIPNFDQALLMQGFIDKPFAVKLGDQKIGTTVSSGAAADIGTMVQVRKVVLTASGPDTASYDLDGAAGGANDTDTGQLVVECVITGLSAQDCKDMKDIIDGTTLGAVTVGSAATVGRVKYPAIGAGTTGTVLIYIAHF